MNLLNYPGSKANLSAEIIGMMPKHRSYLEPFFGSGAVFFRKEKSPIETINDLDGDVAYVVCRVYCTIKQQCPEGAEEFRRDLCRLMEPDSPVWGPPAVSGTSICMVVPGGSEYNGG